MRLADIVYDSAYVLLLIVVATLIFMIFYVISRVTRGILVNPVLLKLAAIGSTIMFALLVIALIVLIILVYIPNILSEGEED